MLRIVMTVLLLWGAGMVAVAQIVRGRVVDAATGEVLPAVAVRYLDRPAVGTMSDVKGRFNIGLRKNRTLVISLLGYKEQRIVVTSPAEITVRLEEKAQEMGTVEVTHKRKKYTRKGNPAVEMMQRVIAAKRSCVLDSLPYCSYNEYKRQTVSIDKFNPTSFTASRKNLAFMAKYASVNPLTGDTILPLMVDETTVEHKHRRDPEMAAHVVTGHRSQGINDLMATGDMVNTLAKDMFPDVDIYNDDIRLFQLHFMSPIADRATSFYHYFIADTVEYGGKRCYELMFLPANARDIGFSGTLHVLADSSWQVQHAELNLPSLSGVNYVDRLRVELDFDSLPGGMRTVVGKDMLVSMSLVDFLTKFEVRVVSRRSQFSTAEIPVVTMEKLTGCEKTTDAEYRDEAFWEAARTLPVSAGEKNMSRMMDDISRMKGFKWLRLTIQMFGENYIETRPGGDNKVDIGPVKQMLGGNYVQGLRVGAGLQTTGRLSPHFFADAFAGVGMKDKRPFGHASVVWSIAEKRLRPHEFPVHSLTLSYSNDVLSSADRVEGHNRDNIFTVFSDGARHAMRQQAIRLTYDREWKGGLRVTAEGLHEVLRPRGALLYQPLMGALTPTADVRANIERLTNVQGKLSVRYQPGTTYVTTKRRRVETNKDAPFIELSYSYAPRRLLGTDYTSNITEMKAHKRFWMYSWGRMDFWANAGAQWNRVPFPLLLAPLTNESLILRKRNFNLINDFEFVNDRYVQLQWQWDLYGKLMNRIPVIRRLGWREYVGANALWGMLTDKNNPAACGYADARLWHMPGEWVDGGWQQFTQVMDKRVPYVEAYAGLTNIFNFFTVQYVHRFTYLHNPRISRWGLRFMIEVTF